MHSSSGQIFWLIFFAFLHRSHQCLEIWRKMKHARTYKNRYYASALLRHSEWCSEALMAQIGGKVESSLSLLCPLPSCPLPTQGNRQTQKCIFVVDIFLSTVLTGIIILEPFWINHWDPIEKGKLSSSACHTHAIAHCCTIFLGHLGIEIST